MSNFIDTSNKLAVAIANVQAAKKSASAWAAGAHNEPPSIPYQWEGEQTAPAPVNSFFGFGEGDAKAVARAGRAVVKQRGGIEDGPRAQFRVLRSVAPFMWPESEPLEPVALPVPECGLPGYVKGRLQTDAGRLRLMLQGYDLRGLAASTLRKRGRKAIPTVTGLHKAGFYYLPLSDDGVSFAKWAGWALVQYLQAVAPEAWATVMAGVGEGTMAAPVYMLTEGEGGQYIWKRDAGGVAVVAVAPGVYGGDGVVVGGAGGEGE